MREHAETAAAAAADRDRLGLRAEHDDKRKPYDHHELRSANPDGGAGAAG